MGVTMSATEIAPGWYPDALAHGHIRYWDGARWTEHTAAPLPNTRGDHGGESPSLPAKPRAPRRRPPMPAFFVVGTVLIGFPIAITIGVLAAHASAPAPLDVPVSGGPIDSADAAAQKDAAAIGLGIERFYQQTLQGGIAAPVVTVSHGNFVLGPVSNGASQWEWPPIPVSEGVSLGGQNGTAEDDWCVWVTAAGGTIQNWQVTADGVAAGTCGL